MNRRPGRRPLRFAASPLWTPKSASGLQLWLRADLGVTIATGVSVWADQSGNGRNFTQGTGGNQPTFTASDASFGGRPSLTFDAVNDRMTATVNILSLVTASAYSAFAVFVNNAGGATTTYYNEAGVLTGNTDPDWAIAAANAQFTQAHWKGAEARVDNTPVNGTAYRWRSIYDGTNLKAHLGSAADTSVAQANISTSSDTGLVLGANYNQTVFWGGKLAEIGVYNKALSAGEDAALQAYLAARYGL